VLAALGPKLLRLACDRAAGAIPVLGTAEHRRAREIHRCRPHRPRQRPPQSSRRRREPSRWAPRGCQRLPAQRPHDLVAAIRTIAVGDAVLSPGATKRLIHQFATGQQPDPPSGRRGAQIREALTAREQEVFSLIATGMSDSEIAERLFLSEGTVKVHVGRILAKLGLRDRVQAVVLAYESGLITPGPHLPTGRRTCPGQITCLTQAQVSR
jgi:DNA-binding CsgD family transcriptional regulator